MALSTAASAWLTQNGVDVVEVANVITGGFRYWPEDDDHPACVCFVERTLPSHSQRARRTDAPLVVEVDRSDDVYKVLNVYRDHADREDHQGSVAFAMVPALTLHAQQRMRDRQVTSVQIHRAITNGVETATRGQTSRFVGEPSPTDNSQLVVIAAVTASAAPSIVTVYYRTPPRFRFSTNLDGQWTYERRRDGKLRDLLRERRLSERPPWS